MQNIINILVFLLILGSIIIIHELGHFLAAKFFGVYCSQFSIGFGPKIYTKKGKETEYEIRAIPFGGFVAMAGEENQEDNDDFKDLPIERTLKGKKTYQKIIIFFAGVFMNFILAIVVLFGVHVTSGQVPVSDAQIGTIQDGSAAAVYGIEPGDIIRQITVSKTGEKLLISDFQDVALTTDKVHLQDDSIDLVVRVERDGKNKDISMKVNYNEETQRYTLGVMQATRRMTFTESIQYTGLAFMEMSTSIFSALKQLVTHFSQTVTQLSGPAGIYQITAEVTQTGQIQYIFNLLAMLSINVGIFNLLPIPGLDGCQIIFAVVEKIIGRELPMKLKMALQMIGLGLVLLLMVFVTYQDILRMLG